MRAETPGDRVRISSTSGGKTQVTPWPRPLRAWASSASTRVPSGTPLRSWTGRTRTRWPLRSGRSPRASPGPGGLDRDAQPQAGRARRRRPRSDAPRRTRALRLPSSPAGIPFPPLSSGSTPGADPFGPTPRGVEEQASEIACPLAPSAARLTPSRALRRPRPGAGMPSSGSTGARWGRDHQERGVPGGHRRRHRGPPSSA